MDKKQPHTRFIKKFIIIFFLFSLISSGLLIISNKSRSNNIRIITSDNIDVLSSTTGDSIILQGTEDPLNITDNALLIETDQDVSLTNETGKIESYYLDQQNGWEVSDVETTITDIQDRRNWIENGGFDDASETSDRINQTFENLQNGTSHDYNNSLEHDPLDGDCTVHNIINQPGAVAMRVHFKNISMEENDDYIFIYAKFSVINYDLWYTDTGVKSDFYSPWIKADTLVITMNTSDFVSDYGYYIDHYEFYNASSSYKNISNSWGFAHNTADRNLYGLGHDHGTGIINGSDAMYISLNSERFLDPDFLWGRYDSNKYVEIYQNLSISRGTLIDACLNFDYFPEFCCDSSFLNLFVAINNQEIYNRDFFDIYDNSDSGKWINSGNIDMENWINTSSIFENILEGEEMNISVGIKVKYSGPVWPLNERFQQTIWIDNFSLILTTIANASQAGVNLTLDGYELIEGNQWGEASLNLSGSWGSNPINLTFNTTSLSLDFKLNTTLRTFRDINSSRTNSLYDEGVSYTILDNGSLFWKYYHNLTKPLGYSNFEINMEKPLNWKVSSVLDPTSTSRLFEGGDVGDDYLKISNIDARNDGFWSITATSPNYFNSSNLEIRESGVWIKGSPTFITGDLTEIRIQINQSNEIPEDLGQSNTILKIYDPQDIEWYEETKIPISNGTVEFTGKEFFSSDMGGTYTYTISWSNGTALGGIKSSFILKHLCNLTIVEPESARGSSKITMTSGELFILKVSLTDAENGQKITNASLLIRINGIDIPFFEVDPTFYPGIYTATIDTSLLGTTGNYDIVVNSSVQGFFDVGFSIEIELKEPVNIILNLVILIAASIIGLLGALSLRAYYFQPKKQKKEAFIISKTQKFKDLSNIQAVLMLNKGSGLPFYTKTYSILKKQDRGLFSGFIQAITTIGEEITRDDHEAHAMAKIKKDANIQQFMEMDFKYFMCLIGEKELIRLVLVLKDNPSKRLKDTTEEFLVELNSNISKDMEDWDGDLDKFEEIVPDILNKYFDLYYKEAFQLPDFKTHNKLKKNHTLSPMEKKVLAFIKKLTTTQKTFYLENVVKLIPEKNKNDVIISLESLLKHKFIYSSNQESTYI